MPRDASTDRTAAPRPARRLGTRRRRLRRTLVALAGVAVLGAAGGLTALWMSRPETYRPGEAIEGITAKLAADLPAGAPRLRLVDVTAEAGLGGFRTFAGPRSSQLPEDMGGGAAWGDYDGDGDDDLFLASNGAALGAEPSRRAPSVLYENLGDGTFRRAPDFPELRILGMGAAWGDVDGDGRLDLVVTGYDTLLLLRNDHGRLVRDERFPAPDGFWAGACWGDFDADRDLDLYVCGYVRYVHDDADRARASRQFGTVVPFTLNPSSYEPQPNLLFVNDGGGTFTEAAASLGVDNPGGRSLGALWHDLDGDGRLDLYVANDVSDNVLYRNLGGRFEEISHAAWVADYRGAMGLAAGDHDRDGDDDLFITHWIAQENALYDSLLKDLPAPPDGEGAAAAGRSAEPGSAGAGGLRYMDVADLKGLGQIALQRIGWGAEFADLDADGWLDLIVANGSTFETAAEPKRLKPQRSFVFWNRRGERFHDLAPFCAAMSEPRVSRGLAVSDYDGDGDQDVLLVHRDAGVQLLRNDTAGGRSIRIRLRSLDADGEPTGAGDGAIVVAQVGDAVLRRGVTSVSYLSQSSRTVHLGLGDARAADRLEVRWPGGRTDVWENLAAGALWELTEGDPSARRVAAATPTADDAAAGEVLTERQRVVAFWEKQRAAMRAMKAEGDLEAAVALFREALRLDPDHEDSRYYLGNCLAALGRTEEAIEQLEALIRLDPRSHRGLARLAVLRAASAETRADLEAARELLLRARSINLEETGVLVALGEVDLLLGDREAAERHLELVNRTNPRSVPALFLRGYLAWAGGDAAEARRLLAAARGARGEDFKPAGATAEGDVAQRMHAETTPLSAFPNRWDGNLDPGAAFAPLDAFLRDRRP